MTTVEDMRFRIRFWGVRGSYPTPGPLTLRHGGNTACVEMQVGGRTLIFDAGSGIIGLGAWITQPVVALFITHGHGDHLVGFPFFRPLFQPRARIMIFGPQLADQTIEQLLTPVMSPPYFPVDLHQLPSHLTFTTLEPSASVIWSPEQARPIVRARADLLSPHSLPDNVRVSLLMTRAHPTDGAAVYRVEYGGKSIVYATDIEWMNGCDKDFLEFVHGTTVLIHDAQYTTGDYNQMKRGFGHSTVEMATEVALRAQVEELILFHHEPTYDDDTLDMLEAQAQARFQRTRSAYEGMEIDLLA